MQLSGFWSQIGLAIAGGVVAEFLHWYMLSRKPEGIGPYLPKPSYWMFTIVMVALGGLMPVLYISGDASALLCFHLGATAPIALQKLLDATPQIVAKQGGVNLVANKPATTLRSFIHW
jgi:hypothetical protein